MIGTRTDTRHRAIRTTDDGSTSRTLIPQDKCA